MIMIFPSPAQRQAKMWNIHSTHGTAQGQRKSDARTIARGTISISTSSETEPRNQALIEWDDKGTFRKDDDSRIPADCELIFGFIKMTVAHKVARHWIGWKTTKWNERKIKTFDIFLKFIDGLCLSDDDDGDCEHHFWWVHFWGISCLSLHLLIEFALSNWTHWYNYTYLTFFTFLPSSVSAWGKSKNLV